MDTEIHRYPNLTEKVPRQWILGYADTYIFYPNLMYPNRSQSSGYLDTQIH